MCLEEIFIYRLFNRIMKSEIKGILGHWISSNEPENKELKYSLWIFLFQRIIIVCHKIRNPIKQIALLMWILFLTWMGQ